MLKEMDIKSWGMKIVQDIYTQAEYFQTTEVEYGSKTIA